MDEVKRLGLIGKDLSYSYSKQIHELLGGCTYDLHELDEKGACDFILKKEYDMINITNPYKELAYGLVDEIIGEDVGSINTIINGDGKLLGANTDLSALKFCIKRSKLKIKNKNVLILGSGAVSKMCKYFCERKKAKTIKICSRSDGFDYNYDTVYSYTDVNIIINATPVGGVSCNTKKSIDIFRLNKLDGIVDFVYNPYLTPLLIDARLKGLKTINGLDILIYQAYFARKIFGDASVVSIEDIKSQIILDNLNIAFIGMMGVGKSFLGEMASNELAKRLIDTDELIEEKVGLSASEIIEEKGIEHFRKQEKEIIKSLPKKGYILSLGGGVIFDKENLYELGNSYFIWVKRNPKVAFLSINDGSRPLVKSFKDYKDIYRLRKKTYKSICESIIINR